MPFYKEEVYFASRANSRALHSNNLKETFRLETIKKSQLVGDNQ